ncbi:unnamed protein product [Ranitomeya imitator]|uniref:Uncharacterized protein n=1 Tax=Ranitomeya imitator TaxID=111125 RepID=A0ABN9LBA1_9NEOB|nr:unnamed protein product [Ranitomeya imitator]
MKLQPSHRDVRANNGRYYGEQMKDVLTEEDFQLYRNVRRRIQQEIARTFHLDASALHLTKPTFFSRINSSEAKTTHDEYWHPHIDKFSARDPYDHQMDGSDPLLQPRDQATIAEIEAINTSAAI